MSEAGEAANLIELPSVMDNARYIGHKLLATAGVIAGMFGVAPAAMADYNPSGKNMRVGGLGEHKTAVVLVNFDNDRRRPFDTEQVAAALFTSENSVNAY